jgi:hypothetical protein
MAKHKKRRGGQRPVETQEAPTSTAVTSAVVSSPSLAGGSARTQHRAHRGDQAEPPLLERRRQQTALAAVLKWTQRSKTKDLQTLLKGLPVQLRTQGLTLLVAHLAESFASEDSREARQSQRRSFGADILDALSTWLLDQDLLDLAEPPPRFDGGDLLAALVQAQTSTYLAAQEEALLFLEELKRMSVVLS